jgi:hypothetical protein
MWIPIDAASKLGLKRTRKRRDSWMISESMSRFIFVTSIYRVSPIDSSLRKPIVILSHMNLLRTIVLSIVVSLGIVALTTTARAQVTSAEKNSPVADAPGRDDAAALQKKANEAQARIHGNKDDLGQLKRAVKLNDVGLAKEVLLRNGFTAEDLENAKITLRTGGGKGGEDEIEISATCCDPKEITIQRTLEYFTK